MNLTQETKVFIAEELAKLKASAEAVVAKWKELIEHIEASGSGGHFNEDQSKKLIELHAKANDAGWDAHDELNTLVYSSPNMSLTPVPPMELSTIATSAIADATAVSTAQAIDSTPETQEPVEVANTASTPTISADAEVVPSESDLDKVAEEQTTKERTSGQEQ